jgi:replication factor A2
LQNDKSGASVQRLTPLLVSQILKAVQQHKDDSFSVDGQELNQITVVGTIKSVTKLSTNLTIVLADATGEVDVRQWLDTDDANADRYRAGMMIRVIGKGVVVWGVAKFGFI